MNNYDRYIGIPYVVGGEPPRGADCWTLCRHILKMEHRVDAPRYFYSEATLTSDCVALISEQSAMTDVWEEVTRKPIDATLIRPGDILLMTLVGYLQHCGIVVKNGEFIHTLRERNSTIEPVRLWANHIDAVMRWRGKA